MECTDCFGPGGELKTRSRMEPFQELQGSGSPWKVWSVERGPGTSGEGAGEMDDTKTTNKCPQNIQRRRSQLEMELISTGNTEKRKVSKGTWSVFIRALAGDREV